MNKKDSLTKKTFQGFFWSAAGSGISAIAQIAILAILARLINVESFGIVQAALIVVGFANLISQMGIGPALVQRKELTEKHIRVGFTFSLMLGLALGGTIFLCSGLISSFFNFDKLAPVLKVVSLLFVTGSFVTVSTSLLQRNMRLKEMAVIDIISYILGYGLIGIIFGYLGFDYWALIIAIFAQEIIKVIAYTILQKHSFVPFWSKQEFKDLIYFGGGFTFGRFFNYVANQGDNIIAGRYLGADALGIYSRAYAIMAKPVSLLGGSIDKALFPAMAARQDQNDRLIMAFMSGSKMITFLCIPVSVIIIFSSNEIVNVLLGEQWGQVIIPLQILTAGLLFRMGYKMGESLCRATGNVYSRAKRQFVYAFCVLVACYIGSHWGIVGVAYGTLFAVTVNYFLMIQLSLTILKINWIYFLKGIFSEIGIMIFLSSLFIGINVLTKSVVTSDILILLITYGTYGIICIILFHLFWEKLSFLKILPIPSKFKKFLREK
ncbi:lipopolysaccharide biosynthesis protein [Aequorivita marisscotiae]|uniref:Lipopolysaccharide biosynthesis protein n=1 Tax=Aequorivita marisscotiae TaxID=3040348 RepID=A0ABY8KST1_9FLAO|nr:lipopolysaccharide biosynthesis protein [Aequorivita sp. Ant34-E75]WGF92216.1 lipopolysaccharide biosynthesis protein [Aequorivita sp. Ant34-E75]